MSTIQTNIWNEKIETKINHIFNTASRGKSALGLGGCSHSVRVIWEYNYFKEFYEKNFKDKPLDESVNMIEKCWPNGLVIVLRNNDYFDILTSDLPLNKMLKSKLGSDNLLSVVIHIESYDSSCKDISHLFEKLKKIDGIIPLCKANPDKNMIHSTKDGISSNCNWKGHYAVNMKGGIVAGIAEGLIPLGNPIYDYASNYVQDSIKYQMIFMMLCCKDAKKLLKNEENFEKVKEDYKQKCQSRQLLDFEKFGIANPFNKNGFLQCCISGDELTAEDFLNLSDKEQHAQYCHISPKSYSDVQILNNEIFTTFRPYNIAWGKAYANRWQGDRSVKELRENITRLSIRFQQIHNDEI
jgi:hypothetical protein